MRLYRYYRNHESQTTPWGCGFDDEVQQLADPPKFVGILAMDRVLDGEVTDDPSEVKYLGPFYVDIDNQEDLGAAIDAGREFVRKVTGLGLPVEALNICLSGSKGLHITIHEKYFGITRPIQHLPRIWAELAQKLYVPGLDPNVYKGGKGLVWRRPNVQREKDGRFKVPITYQELQSLTPEQYLELVRQPRFHLPTAPVQPPNAITPVARLTSLFDTLRNTLSKPPRERTATPIQHLQALEGQVPPCIEDLLEYRNLAAGGNFSARAMQFGAFCAAMGWTRQTQPAKVRQLTQAMAAKATSNSYKTPAERQRHLEYQIHRGRITNPFTCAAMVSVLKDAPCARCPVEQARAAERGVVTDAEGQPLASATSLEQRRDGYYTRGRFEKRLTYFTLEVVCRWVDDSEKEFDRRQTERGRRGYFDKLKKDENGVYVESLSRLGVDCQIREDGDQQVTDEIYLGEEAWTGRNAFIKALKSKGVQSVVYLGNDQQVQELKKMALDQGALSRVMHVADAVGIIYRTYFAESEELQQRIEVPVFTYIEPGWSYNNFRQEDTHHIQQEVKAPPQLHTVKLPKPEDAVAQARFGEAVNHLLAISDPVVVGQLLGWYCGALLRTHIRHSDAAGFPILFLYGPAGSGKSTLAKVFSLVHGVDLFQSGAVSAMKTTPYEMEKYLHRSTTCVRVVEEYNRRKMPKNKYDTLAEIFKNTWNLHSTSRATGVGKGRVDERGSDTETLTVKAPVLVCGEQAPTLTALIQRSVLIGVQQEYQKGRGKHVEYFEDSVANRNVLKQLGMALIAKALTLPLDWVKTRCKDAKKWVPHGIDHRGERAYEMLFVGLDLLEETLKDEALNKLKQINVNAIRRALIDRFSDTAYAARVVDDHSHSEMDQVMEMMVQMTYKSVTGQQEWLMEGVDYIRTEKYLYLCPFSCAANIARFVQLHGLEDAPRVNMRTLQQMLRQEPYLVCENAVMRGAFNGQTAFKLDIEGMRMRGINVDVFPLHTGPVLELVGKS